MKTSDIITAKEWLTEPKKIVIIPHKNPDGDAMGSALGFTIGLSKNTMKLP